MFFPSVTRLFLPLALASMAAGCGYSKDSGTLESHHVLAGFNHTWDFLSHRVSLSELFIEADGTITSGIIGGDFSTGDIALDFVRFRVAQSRVTAPGLFVGHGSLDLVVGPDGAFSETVTLDVPGIADAGSVTAAFAGFRVSSNTAQGADYPTDYDPALGYTTKGWGFTIGEPTLSGDTATLTVSGIKRWAPTDNDADPADRSDMNGAIPYAQSEISVYYTVIGFDGVLTPATGSASVDYPHGSYSAQPPMTQDDLGIGLDASGVGFPILRSYDLLLEDQTSDQWGDYIRSYGIELEGGAPMKVTTEMTNSSLIEVAEVRFVPTVDVGWVSLSGDATVETIATSGSHDIGSTSFTPNSPPEVESE
ncbi:MAG TPA: hypothetical protein DFR83_20570 [Deltaproteobacteria bacterium]|nr:hypothetical protein [Deltaproteobacteria bacterium]